MYKSLILKTCLLIHSSGSVRTSPSIRFYQQRWELHHCMGTGRIPPRQELTGLGGRGHAIQPQAGGFVPGRDSEVKSIKGESRLGTPESSLPVWWPVSTCCCRLGRGTLLAVTGQVAEPQPILYNPLSYQHQTAA